MAKFPEMKKSELLALVKEVSASLKTIGAAELARMTKSEGSSSEGSSFQKDGLPPEGSASSASSEGSSSGSLGSEGSASAGGMPPGADAPPAGPGMEGSAPPAGPPSAPGAEGSAPPAGMEGSAPPAGPPGAEGQAPPGPSFEELVSLYLSLPDADFEAHAAAFQQAAAQRQASGAQPGMEGSAPPAGPSAPPAGPPMGKQEVATNDPNIGLAPGGGTPGKVATANPNIGKSEADALMARLAKSESDLQAMGKVLETVLTIPQRKAVTGMTIIPMRKSEAPVAPSKKAFADVTRAELQGVLRVATHPSNTKLTKSERDVVTEYCLNPANVDLSAIESIYNKA